jgi:pSer/pThr/pTyr-binding forkhead associated (FHA) protein
MCHVHVRPLVPHEIDAQDIEAQDVESQDEPEATAAGVRMALLFAGGRLDVPPDGLVVGRSSDACRRLPDMRTLDQISRHEHARFYWEDDVLYVVDCGSTNGTYVAGVPAVRPIPVSPGAALRFAKDVPVEVVALDEFGMLSRED